MALSSVTEHWIRQDALTITLNVLGPDIIQASVLSGTAIAAYKSGVIGYDAGHNFRTWPLTAYATALEYTGPNYVYAKLTRNEKSPKALISYSKDEIDIEGRRTLEDGSYSEIDAEYFYVYLGKISASVDESGNQVDRYWIDSFRFGTLGTNQFQMEESEADWTRMFRLNKVSDVIEVLKNIVSATIQKLTVVTHLIIGGKTLTDVATSSDTEQFKKPSDTHIATPGYVDSYSESTRMSKLHDDTVQGNIEFAKEIKIGEELTVDGKSHFNGDVNVKGDTYFGEYIPSATGACIKKGEDGNWLVETDHLLVRKKATFTTVEIQDVRHVGGQILLSSAEAVVEYVEKTGVGWKCYFRATDGEKTITNDWVVGDQAYCNVFNLEGGSHYLWRRVESVGKGRGVVSVGGQKINLSEYYYIELSLTNATSNSDEPQAGDHLVQLGNQSDDSRQNAIVIAGAGEGSPYIHQFVGINSFTLPSPELRLSPNDNLFTGKVIVQGSKKYNGDVSDLLEGLEQESKEYADETIKNARFSKYNMLRNSGFTGDYLSSQIEGDMSVDKKDLFSDPYLHWSCNKATIELSVDSLSGYEMHIAGGGSIMQTLQQTSYYSQVVKKGKQYTISFKAKGGTLSIGTQGGAKEFILSDEMKEYTYHFTATQDGYNFGVSAKTDVVICDLQLSYGNAVAEWGMSILDNQSELANYETLAYLSKSLQQGKTEITGGLLLSDVVMCGDSTELPEGEERLITSGISGLFNDDDSVAFWAGGNLSQAARLVTLLKDNPNYQPTEAEWANLAKFVVTHGGESFMRGYVYALGGVFRGTVYANDGEFSGFLRKRKTEITPSNVESYFDVIYLGDISVLLKPKWDKLCGYIYFSGDFSEKYNGKNVQISFPSIDPEKEYSETELEEARSCVGNSVILYNKSVGINGLTGQFIATDYSPDSELGTHSPSFGLGQCLQANCVLTHLYNSDNEAIVWRTYGSTYFDKLLNPLNNE